MKNKIISIALLTALLVGSCKQEVLEFEQPTAPEPGPTPTRGTADFTKFVALGTSLSAGYQAGALFNEGQSNSLAKILSDQFATVGGGAFNQPDINSVNGYSSEPVSGYVLGRFILFDPDGPTVRDAAGNPVSGTRSAAPYPSGFLGSTVTCPSTVTTPALPAPYNTADRPTAFDATKRAALNNFAVPGVLLTQIITPETGNPASPYFNGLWFRFASQPGSKTILQDAIAANGTFFSFELGANDILGYAYQGGLNTATPLTSVGSFQTDYSKAITDLLTSNANLKGVIANIPDVTAIPFFFTVTWNNITLTQANVDALNNTSTGLSTNYNGFLDQIRASFPSVISQAEVDRRKLTFKVGSGNPILIEDETLTDLSPYMTGSAAALLPYKRTRQTTSSDLVTLTAGGVLGTCFNNSASAVYGVSYPIGDQYVLIPSETTEIRTRTAELNAVIKSFADANPTRVALADINALLNTLVQNRAAVVNGVTLTPSFAPPTGAFSEDGVHPNSRGYAYMANTFIDAINARFGATLPKVDVSKYKGTGLPVNP